MRLFLDSNIAIDALEYREPQPTQARLLLSLAKLNELEVWFNSTQISDLAYILSGGGKRSLMPKAASCIKSLCEALHVCSCGREEILRAIDDDWPDLEDAFVYEAARSIKADAIITRNQEDFEKSKIPVFDCEEFFVWYAQEHGIDYMEIAFS